MFSIIMPVYNRSGIIGKAIKSVLCQRFKEYELIIVDDGSDNDLEEEVQEYLSDKVKLFRIRNSGAVTARNFGLSKARYDLIAYLDSDNQWHVSYLEKMHKALESIEGEYKAAYCMAKVFGQNEKGKDVTGKKLGKEFSFKELLRGNYIDLNTFIHTKNVVDFAGGFDKKFKRLMDWDFITRVSMICEPIFVNEVLVDYYATESNAINKRYSRKKYAKIYRKKYKKLLKPQINHDGIRYDFPDISESRVVNWGRLHYLKLNLVSFKAWGKPAVLQVEPSSRCNLKCTLCPVGRKELGREYRDMGLDEFKALVDDVKCHVMLMVLWDWGEPFMNKHLPGFVEYATQNGIRTVTSTNAHFLHDEQFVTDVMRSGLSTLIIAVDSLDAEQYKLYRQNGHLDQVLRGIEHTIRIKKENNFKTNINIRTVVMSQNECELALMREFAKKAGADYFSVKSLNPVCGAYVSDDLVPKNKRYRRFVYDEKTFERIKVEDPFCDRIWHSANIISNGNVVPCCQDFSGKLSLGNVFEQPFSKIWNGPKYQRFRQEVSSNKEQFDICRNCSINFEQVRKGVVIQVYDFNGRDAHFMNNYKIWYRSGKFYKTVVMLRNLFIK